MWKPSISCIILDNNMQLRVILCVKQSKKLLGENESSRCKRGKLLLIKWAPVQKYESSETKVSLLKSVSFQNGLDNYLPFFFSNVPSGGKDWRRRTQGSISWDLMTHLSQKRKEWLLISFKRFNFNRAACMLESF